MNKKIGIFIFGILILVGTLSYSFGLFGSSTSSQVSSLEKGLIAHYPLNGESGTKDVTPYGKDGSIMEGVSLNSIQDRYNNEFISLMFAGDPLTSHLNIANPIVFQNNTPWSISLWVYRMAPPGIDRGGIGNRGYPTISISGTQATFWIGSTQYWHIPYGKSITNSWHMLSFVVDENRQLKLYVDGEETNNLSLPSSYFRISSIGSGNTINRPFKGFMSGVRIYNRALSEEEIKLLYDSYNSVSKIDASKETKVSSLTKGLVLDMPLTTKHMKSSTVVSDLTPYGNDGIITGATVGSDGTSFEDGVIELGDVLDMGLNDFTISMWIKSSSIQSSNMYLLSKSRSAAQSYRYGVKISNNGKPGIFMAGSSGGDVNFDGVTNVCDNVWHNLIFIYDRDGDAKIYVDGVYDSGRTISMWDSSDMQSNNPFRVGAYTSSDNVTPVAFYNGGMSGLKIYNRALSEDEIKLLYEKGRN